MVCVKNDHNDQPTLRAAKAVEAWGRLATTRDHKLRSGWGVTTTSAGHRLRLATVVADAVGLAKMILEKVMR
jgi:hypothetical protein